MDSKPHISGVYRQDHWMNWEYDTPLFSMWVVSWDEWAACGHESCGIEWMQEEFATWNDAMKFALDLVKDSNG